MAKQIGIEIYCRECQHEQRYNDCYEAPFDCPKCEKPVYRSSFITCECGTTVYLDSHTNGCGECGRLYNAFGQELAPPEDWDEEDRYACFGPQNLTDSDY